MKFFTILLLFFASPLIGLQVSSLSYCGEFKPGETKQVKVTLINEKEHVEKVEFHLCDYACTSEGLHFFEEPGKMERSNASWISLSQEQVTLEPKSQLDFFYKIEAPNNPSLIGSFWSVLLIEPQQAIQKLTEKENGFTMDVKIRYVHHIVTNLKNGNAKLKITNKEFKIMDNKQFLKISVLNTGDLFINPKLTLKLYDDQGKLKNTLEGQTERLYPGNSQSYLVATDGVESGKFTGFLLLDNGDNNFFGDTFQLIIP
jgi:hypothetical protein